MEPAKNKNQLSTIDSGELKNLEELGVSAFSNDEVEKNVLEQLKAAQKRAAIAPQPSGRRRILKKPSTVAQPHASLTATTPLHQQTEQERLVSCGEQTPFHFIQGFEKTFKRIPHKTSIDRTDSSTLSSSSLSSLSSSSLSSLTASSSNSPSSIFSASSLSTSSFLSSSSAPFPLVSSSSSCASVSSSSSLSSFASSSTSLRMPPPSSVVSSSSISSYSYSSSSSSLSSFASSSSSVSSLSSSFTSSSSPPSSFSSSSSSTFSGMSSYSSSSSSSELSMFHDENEEDNVQVVERRSSQSTKAASPSRAAKSPSRKKKASRQEEDDKEEEEGEEGEVVDEEEEAAIEEDEALAESSSSSSSSSSSTSSKLKKFRLTDDSEEYVYQERLEALKIAREKKKKRMRSSNEEESLDVVFEGGYTMPGSLWDRLFEYQKTGVKWLWELHCQNTGGIIADEMGLGKTIQIISFLAGLHYTNSGNIKLGPTLIVCPATIMAQWMHEFHEWYPELRVMIMHESGQSHHVLSRKELIKKVIEKGHILITTYEAVRLNQDLLIKHEWGYVILDEGHKIRNPDAGITLACKQLLTLHRIILSGAPIQNRLRELWSLFDFVFPGKLGTLPVFEEEFCIPINQGGYTHATKTQVSLAYKCAVMLRDIINPYILRRTKTDVAKHLPKKTEHVLFCNLAPQQRLVYKNYLKSKDIQAVLAGRGSLFQSIIALRKVCNHPDLLKLQGVGQAKKVRPLDIKDYGSIERSGKMQVMHQVLQMWHKQGHRALLFSQTRQMLDILEDFVKSKDFSYRRIDGTTPIRNRIPMIDEFNHDSSVFLMLLTTRAGGLGVNLTGADRVLLFDPDWNPSTDVQARERAYRIGQHKSVTVYRLIGTIEEKVYHRQIFKQYLTNKVLLDPKQNRFFSRSDLADLFTLGSETRHDNAMTDLADAEISKQDYVEKPKQTREKEKKKQQGEEKEQTNDEKDDITAQLRAAEEKEKQQEKEKEKENDEEEEVEEEDASEKKRQKLLKARVRQEQKSSNDDRSILSMLFEKQGIDAYSHDRLMDTQTEDTSALEAFASEIAQKAMKALKQSRREMRGHSVAEPTWTGSKGKAGRPNSFPRKLEEEYYQFAASGNLPPPLEIVPEGDSKEVKEHEKQKGQQVQDAFTSNDKEDDVQLSKKRPSQEKEDDEEKKQVRKKQKKQKTASKGADVLVSELCEYMQKYPSGIDSDSLISRFSNRVVSVEDKYVFRTLLHKVATLTRRGRESVWKLKEEYQ